MFFASHQISDDGLRSYQFQNWAITVSFYLEKPAHVPPSLLIPTIKAMHEYPDCHEAEEQKMLIWEYNSGYDNGYKNSKRK